MSFDLSKIGTMLKAAREEKQLTTHKVAEVLFIRRRIIEAIEAGQWEKLPHEVYVKGYVTQYAAFLAIDHSINAELHLRQDVPDRTEPRIVAMAREPVKSRWEPRRRVIGTVAVAMIGTAFLVYQNMDKRTYVAPATRQQAGVQQQAYEPQQPRADYQTVAANTYEDNGQVEKVVFESKKLTIACQQRTWLRIVIDGFEKKEIMMNPEEVLVLDGREGFDLLIGNAGGIKLFYNGKDTGFMGGEGEVKRISLS